MAGKNSVWFTLSYVKLCSILTGTRMKLTWALTSIARRRGSQKRPSCKPYSIATALICPFIDETNALTLPEPCQSSPSVGLGDRPDVDRNGQTICRANQLSATGVEPERTDGQIPLWLARTNFEFPQLDDLAIGKPERHRIAGLIREYAWAPLASGWTMSLSSTVVLTVDFGIQNDS